MYALVYCIGVYLSGLLHSHPLFKPLKFIIVCKTPLELFSSTLLLISINIFKEVLLACGYFIFPPRSSFTPSQSCFPYLLQNVLIELSSPTSLSFSTSITSYSLPGLRKVFSPLSIVLTVYVGWEALCAVFHVTE